ncbi:MAG: hypothetical protein A2Z14_17905 [Chloroflexi bacterium RBG_16_48_8]|nr:MAG: hypothetical protein A2Z14_17905 [Chloroflexi bacterium RBG_16_48_8]
MVQPIFEIAIPLFCAHTIVDFILHPDDVVERKGGFLNFLKHVLWIGILSYVFVGTIPAWQMVLAVMAFHGVIDYLKIRSHRQDFKAFMIDQCAHLTVMILLSAFLASSRFYSESSIWNTHFGETVYSLQVFAIGALLSTYVGGIVVGIAVQPLLAQLEQKGNDSRGKSPDLSEIHARGLKDAGKIIGYLERSLIYLFVIVNQPSSIGFLIAAKSIFRFGEIKERSNRMEAEYIIIGTLLSFLFGLMVSFAVKAILQLLS